MSNKNHIQRVHIWDDAKSRINFLETTLADKEWEAVVYEPTEDGSPGRLTNLKKEFDAKGYKTKIGTDENNIPTLTLTHFSHETSLLKMVGELGLTKGVRQTLETGGQRAGSMIQRAKDLVGFFMGSEARLFSTVYAIGDVTLSGIHHDLFKKVGLMENKETEYANEFFQQYDEATGKTEGMFKAAYYLAFMQSIIMMFGSKEGKEILQQEITYGMSEAEKKGLDLTDFDQWAAEIQDNRSGFRKWYEDNAVQLGSGTQMLGQLILLAAGIKKIRDTNEFVRNQRAAADGSLTKHLAPDIANGKNGQPINMEDIFKRGRIGGIGDILTGTLSTTGWYLIGFQKEKEIENKVDWSANFFQRLGQEIQSSPNKLASFCVTAASIIGMPAGYLKKGAGNYMAEQNQIELNRNATLANIGEFTGSQEETAIKSFAQQLAGERSTSFGAQEMGNAYYLIGDATVFLTKNRNYEAGQVANTGAMADTAVAMMNQLPVAFSESGKEDFVAKLSGYLAHRIENIYDPNNPPPADLAELTSEERVAIFTKEIFDEVYSRLPQEANRFESIAQRAADVAMRFGSGEQESVISNLAETLEKSHGVKASKAELTAAIHDALAAKTLAGAQAGVKLSKAVMAPQVKKPLAALVQAIPGNATAQDAMALYSCLEPHLTRARPSDAIAFEEFLLNHSEQQKHPRINQTAQAEQGAAI